MFPNALVALPDIRNFTDPRCLTVFFGALNREQDWQPLMGAINAVAKAVGERLRFSVVHDRGFFDALDTPHKQFTAMCEYDAYMDLLGACEVSLMPLADNGFNRAKSDLKFIEAGACRVAALASDVVYGETIEDGRTGLLFRDADELQSKLMQPGGDAGHGARPGRRGARLRGAAPHAGLSDRAAHRLVSLAMGAPRRADRGAARAAGGGARTGDVKRCGWVLILPPPRTPLLTGRGRWWVSLSAICRPKAAVAGSLGQISRIRPTADIRAGFLQRLIPTRETTDVRPTWHARSASWPAKAGHPRLSFVTRGKVVGGRPPPAMTQGRVACRRESMATRAGISR